MEIKKLLFTVVIILPLCASARISSQQTVTNKSSDTLRQDSVHTLDELEVSATTIQKEINSSIPTFRLTTDDLDKKGISGIGDAMRRMAGVSLKDYGGAGGMKTVSVRGMGAQHTGVAIDGITLTDARSGQIDLSRYTLENVSSLSMHIGDGDDIFIPARNASTPALLEITTLGVPQKAGRTQLTARFKFGSFQYLGSYLRWARNLSEKFAMSINGEFIHAKNDYPFRLCNLNQTTHERRSNSRMNSGSGDINAVWRINGKNVFKANLHYYDNDRQLPGQVKYYTNYSRETLHDRNFFGQTGIKSRISPLVSLRGDMKFNWESSSYRDPSYTGGVRDADYYQREVYATTGLLITPHSDWALSYSVDYAYANLNSFQISSPNQKPERNTVYQTLTGRYSDGRISATARLLLTLCYNSRKEEEETARNARRLSPSVSVSWKLTETEDIFLRASYKDIFRLPTFTESYYFHFGSTDLKPEKTSQFNIGGTWQHNYGGGNSFRMTADSYINIIRDMIIAVPYNMFIWTNINLGKTTAKGVDITASLEHQLYPNQTILLSSNWSWQRVLNRTEKNSPYYGNQPAYMPVNSGAFSIGWENPWLNISVSGTAVSGRWATSEHYDSTRVGGYMDLNLTLYRSIHINKKHNLEIRFDLRNFLNRQYEVIRLYPMPGINYQASLTWRL